MSSRTSSSTQDSAPLPSTSPRVVQFTTTGNDRKHFMQFHVISAVGLSEKASGKRPATSFVGMTVGKHYYTTSTVSSKESDPVWHDNLGPIWLNYDAKVTFKVKYRTMPLLPVQTFASTKAYRLQELVEQQADIWDRNCSIDLPLRLESAGPTTSKLTINIRAVSSAESAFEEVAKARARSNSIKQEEAMAAQGLQSEDIDSGEDLSLVMKAARLENDDQLSPIPILPSKLSP
ncbi:hypothetical protein Moror_17890 [Moniliophthora roreri MCA 2997]|uniref:C2 domain-containing protein n=1 Tax=Moniliophthora roreri (strain MCA 2997) TaxID=1381753 RepID=V2YZV4_MONRO|nr:hypothetical protein Moror_17890 [Moniliophthora roreri MCA 2997]KAI3612072.1 hypothetical protein WG66_016085 [Moniliophthora roreri]